MFDVYISIRTLTTAQTRHNYLNPKSHIYTGMKAQQQSMLQ